MTTRGLKFWIIVVAALVLLLVYADQHGGGSISFDLGVGAVLSLALVIVAAWQWGGWRRS